MKPQLHYIHEDAQIGKTYYLWGFYILCLLFRGDAAILIVCGEISYGNHTKLPHPYLGVGFSATVKAIISLHIPGYAKCKQEFGSNHCDDPRRSQTHAFLPTQTSLCQLVEAQELQDH